MYNQDLLASPDERTREALGALDIRHAGMIGSYKQYEVIVDVFVPVTLETTLARLLGIQSIKSYEDVLSRYLCWCASTRYLYIPVAGLLHNNCPF